MAAITILGAVLVACGLVLMALAAIHRGRLSDPHASPDDPAGTTLEPQRRGVGFLGLKANWPGLLVAAIGAVLLALPFFLGG
ncbi:hypothetical protein VE25_16180 [Devosia geojensis]|uniref:Uncharacterized protein n=1 Tax=Devosia geojensis TaxID=443610 RepID=A0A0F5FPL9_9HYPH|nr:hypothetical protein [Devosia geojensis]KKB10768.1 hypothetical protein VE25_16180 [Devosia geojensis]